MKIKLTLNLSKLTRWWTVVSVERTSKVSLGLRPETGAWLSPPVKCIMIDWHLLVFISKQNEQSWDVVVFSEKQGQDKKCRPQSKVNPQRTWLARTIFCILRQSHLSHYHGSAALFLSWQRSWLASAFLPGTNPMNLPRVKYLSSSWDRKAVSPRSGFSAISCVTLNCAQEMFTRNKTRCIISQLRVLAVSVSVTGDKIVIKVWEWSSRICHASHLMLSS